MTDRYLIVSADMHAGADVQGYRPYLEAKWLDEFDAWAATMSTVWGESEMTDTADRDRARRDSDFRNTQIDGEGIAAEVLFPDTYPPFFPSNVVFANQPRNRDDYERRWAGLKAHNRWMVDFIAQSPERRRSPIQLFLYDIDDAVAEVRWGHDHGLTAVLVPAVAPNHTLEGLWSERYDPIWAVCQELGLPVNQHIGAGTPDIVGNPAEGAALLYEVHWYARRSMWNMIFGGAFERFPDLKFIMTEEGLAWVPSELRRLDLFVEHMLQPELDQSKFGYPAISKLSLTPTEYFQRNVWIGASFLSPAEIGHRHDVGVDKIMWGADYPHSEGTFPYTTESLRATFSGAAEQECRKMLGETAAALYGFDLDALRPLADRIGPTVDEVATPLDEYPEGSLMPIYQGPIRPEPGELTGYCGEGVAV